MENKLGIIAIFISLLASMFFLFLLLTCNNLDFFSLLLIGCNIISFSFLVISYKKNIKFIESYRHSYYIFILIYMIFVMVFIFLSFYLSTFYIFLSPCNISIIVCVLEVIVFAIINLDYTSFVNYFSFKKIVIKNYSYLFGFEKIKTKRKICKISLISTLISILPILLFVSCGCISSGGRLELFSQNITFAELATDETMYLSFENIVNNNNELINISKGFTDYSYYGQKKYAPIVIRQTEIEDSFAINNSYNISGNSFSFLSFYTFDCYISKGKWISTYSGLTYLGDRKTSDSIDYHNAFISLSLAEKIKHSKDLEDINDVVGKTINYVVNGEETTFFISNIILDDSLEYKQYYTNYGDFIVLPYSDKIIKNGEATIDFYFTNSTSYNKELLKYVSRCINNSCEWTVTTNSSEISSSEVNGFWNLNISNNTQNVVLIIMFLLGLASYLLYFFIEIFIVKNASFFSNQFIVLLIMVLQTIMFCLWQYIGVNYLPSLSICLSICVFCFTTFFSTLSRKEGNSCVNYSNQIKYHIISI